MAPNLKTVDFESAEDKPYNPSGIAYQNFDQLAGYKGFWGRPTSTNDFCEQNYEVVSYIAEFWSTITNLVIILTGLWGIYETQRQGFERRYQIIFCSLLTVGVGSWMFHMTLQYEMQLLDELPMVWGGCIALYEMHQIQRPKADGYDVKLGIFLFVAFGIGFPVVYLRWRNPVILFVSYGTIVANIAWIDLRLLSTQYTRAGMKLYVIGFAMQIIGVILWSIDNVYCSKLEVLRGEMHASLAPFTQLHGWWHILAGYSSYLHIIYCLHHRQIFLKQSAEITIQPWIGITIKADTTNQKEQRNNLLPSSENGAKEHSKNK